MPLSKIKCSALVSGALAIGLAELTVLTGSVGLVIFCAMADLIVDLKNVKQIILPV